MPEIIRDFCGWQLEKRLLTNPKRFRRHLALNESGLRSMVDDEMRRCLCVERE